MGVRKKISRADLDKIGLLGCGGFGVVDLVEHKESGESFALKGLNKGHVVKTQMQQSVMAEKNIMLMSNSDFIVKLYATYNSSQVLYFLLEVALGGELYATYNSKGFYGSDKHAKYYVAGVVFAFEHLHERFVIYRDLKPENVLLNSDGHPKLTDMGLAKFVLGKTFTTCGTPDYFAPEVIATSGQTSAVDWWTLGILLFELMVGKPPFESPQPMQTYVKVTEIHYSKGDLIVKQGESGSSFYILFDGAVSIIVDDQEVNKMSADLHDGNTQTFGEKALQNNDVRAASVRVTSDIARALVSDRETFNMLLGSLDALQQGHHQNESDSANRLMSAAQAGAQQVRKKISRADLDKIGLLGCGGFGVVDLVEHKESGE